MGAQERCFGVIGFAVSSPDLTDITSQHENNCWKAKFLKQRERMVIKVSVTVVKSYEHSPFRQRLFAFNCRQNIVNAHHIPTLPSEFPDALGKLSASRSSNHRRQDGRGDKSEPSDFR
jgi:hypothetical protein